MAKGILNFFLEDGPKKPDTRIDLVKEELKKQELWIRHLHNYSRDLYKYADYINESNTKHKNSIVSEINKINQWISHLYESHSILKEEISSLKTELKSSIRKDFEQYNRIINEYLKLKFYEQEKSMGELKAILDEFKANKRINNADNAKPINSIMHYNTETELTNPEKELLNLLFNESKPMTYEAIASKLNRSLNTVRVYMNSLRSKKQIIDEFLTPSGTKVFSIKNSELVKTLFSPK